jgi:hypothetical protein
MPQYKLDRLIRFLDSHWSKLNGDGDITWGRKFFFHDGGEILAT